MRQSLHLSLHVCMALFGSVIATSPAQSRSQPSTPLIETGEVLDFSGAAIAHARLSIQLPEGVKQVEADDLGAFHLAFPKPGDYRITVNAIGFDSSTIAVSTATMPDVLTVTLQIAGRADIVEVEGGDTGTIQSTQTQLGGVVNLTQLAALPINGRSFTDLLALSPGVVPTSSAQPQCRCDERCRQHTALG